MPSKSEYNVASGTVRSLTVASMMILNVDHTIIVTAIIIEKRMTPHLPVPLCEERQIVTTLNYFTCQVLVRCFSEIVNCIGEDHHLVPHCCNSPGNLIISVEKVLYL